MDLVNWIIDNKEAIGLILGPILGSALIQKIKTFFKLDSPKLLVFITALISFAAAVIPAALGWLAANPGSLGTHTAEFFTGLTLAYRYVIQPAVKVRAAVVQYNAELPAKEALTDGVQPSEVKESIYNSVEPVVLPPSPARQITDSPSQEYDG